MGSLIEKEKWVSVKNGGSLYLAQQNLPLRGFGSILGQGYHLTVQIPGKQCHRLQVQFLHNGNWCWGNVTVTAYNGCSNVPRKVLGSQ